jgi:hypothetical protein
MYNPFRPREPGLIEALKAIAKLEADNAKYFLPKSKYDLSSLVPEIPKPDYSGLLKILGIKEQPISKINLSSFIPDLPKPDSLALPKLFGLPKVQSKVSLPSSIFGSLVPKPEEKPRVFISFDYDHDEDLKHSLVGQSKLTDSPFDISDWSIKEPIQSINWEKPVYEKIQKVNTVIIIVGEATYKASGVIKEIAMAKHAGIP